MRLLRRDSTGALHLTVHFPPNIPQYAILSHRWGPEEVTFQDLRDNSGTDKSGHRKLQFCGEQAQHDGLSYFWVDTCCIDKKDAVELQESINSMFHWYQNAARCYVYLDDVSGRERQTPHTKKQRHMHGSLSQVPQPPGPLWHEALRKSAWFTRGWTLQELLAPASVEFFSREGARLGDKQSLEPVIHEVTRIPVQALRNCPLSDFSIDERFSWMDRRETTRVEDKAYALLGILGVRLRLDYGEGRVSAFSRLRKKTHDATLDSTTKSCLRDLQTTDPHLDKKRIEETKGGLLRDAYQWVFDTGEFQQWRNDEQCRLLWIKGDPGKGKTMLLCGIINELEKASRSGLLSYFFCQAADPRLNSATAVLRGLILMMVDQQPLLVSHLQKKYNILGKQLFEDANAWTALTEILSSILEDPKVQGSYLLIDALDECITGLDRLLDLIQRLAAKPSVKWIVSGRNWSNIVKSLNKATQRIRLCLELNEEFVSTAVEAYVTSQVEWLAEKNDYDGDTQTAVQHHLSSNAHGTFLWVALICQELANVPGWRARKKALAFPPGLGELYERMFHQIGISDDMQLCTRILAVVCTSYRPLTLDELVIFINLPDGVSAHQHEVLAEIISLCGSFLTLRNNTIFFVHQSAKDFLLESVPHNLFPSGAQDLHYDIFSRSLQALSNTLRRDIYNLGDSGSPIDQVDNPSPDPLATTQYSCIFWIDHLRDCCDMINRSQEPSDTPVLEVENSLRDGGLIDNFLRKHYLHWLEALSLLRSLSQGVLSMAQLEALVQDSQCARLVHDARRFVQYHRAVIENYPMQIYTSALLFSPTESIIRKQFRAEEPLWIDPKPILDKEWSACLTTLEGHSGSVYLVVWSSNGQLASGSYDNKVKIWDTGTGQCVSTLEGHGGSVYSIAWSSDGRLASGSEDNTIKIWHVTTGQCISTLKGHSGWVTSVVWLSDGRLASSSEDNTVKIWDTMTGQYISTLEGHSDSVWSIAWSSNGQLASGSYDNKVKIWDAVTGQCVSTLEGHDGSVWSVAWSSDGRLASGSEDNTIKIWHVTTGQCISTLKGHSGWVTSVIWSSDGRLASGSYDNTVKIWDTVTGQCVSTLKGHSRWVTSVIWSSDGRLASGSYDNTVKIWDTASSQYKSTLEGHRSSVTSVVWSSDGRLASSSYDNTVKIWNVTTGQCMSTLKGHSRWITSVAWSTDGRLASRSEDNTVDIWDATTGQYVSTLEGPGNTVTCVVWSSNDRLVCGQEDSQLLNQAFGYGLKKDGTWITFQGRDLIWLPKDYRPTHTGSFAVFGRRVAVGCASGRVLLLGFSEHITIP